MIALQTGREDSHTQIKPPACVARNPTASALPITAKPRGFVRRRLGENLSIPGKPDRHRDADVVLDLARRSAPAPGPALIHAAVRCRSSRERFVDGERLDLRREFEHQRAHLAADAGILFHVGPNDRRVRQSLRALNIGIAERTPKVRAM